MCSSPDSKKMRIKATSELLVLLLIATLPSLAQNKQTPAPLIPTPIEQGDKLFEQMKYPEAIAAYSKDSNNAEAQWKISRGNVCYADIITKDREYYYIKAEKAARSCVKINPKLSYGHSWLAASLGNLAMYQGSRTKVMLCNEIKSELDKALVLNSKDDIALSIYGSFYHALGNISWLERNLAMLFLGGIPEGGYEDSEKYFLK